MTRSFVKFVLNNLYPTISYRHKLNIYLCKKLSYEPLYVCIPTRWTWVWISSRSWWWTRKLACCSPWGRKESDTTEWLNWSMNTHTHTHTHIYMCVCVCVCVYVYTHRIDNLVKNIQYHAGCERGRLCRCLFST